MHADIYTKQKIIMTCSISLKNTLKKLYFLHKSKKMGLQGCCLTTLKRFSQVPRTSLPSTGFTTINNLNTILLYYYAKNNKCGHFVTNLHQFMKPRPI